MVLEILLAILAVAVLAVLPWRPCTVPLRIVAFLGALGPWHWPWFAAALLVAPRLPLLLPGLLSTLLASWRHPRPSWPAAPDLRRGAGAA
jgi:hypothetical protein